MTSTYRKLESAHANDQRVRILLKGGTALENCRVSEIRDTTFVLTLDDGRTTAVRRSQMEHVLLNPETNGRS
jgi:predicted nucleotidyltransferase component of viral defense system